MRGFGDPEKRFWQRVTKGSSCWLWSGAQSREYGQIRAYGRKMGAHIFAYELLKGPVPNGKCVCHSCDTPLCVNPDHLWLGTNADNQADKRQKGRSARGEMQRHTGKLTADQVLAIRASDTPRGTLADQYGVSKNTIRRIIIREDWAHI